MTEQNNRLVLGTVDSLVSRYFVWHEDGTKEPDHEMRELVKKSSIEFCKFFSEHGLFKDPCFDEKGNFIDREYRRNDLTDEGYEMFKRDAIRWIDSKGAVKEPPNYRMLEKILAEIRSGK